METLFDTMERHQRICHDALMDQHLDRAKVMGSRPWLSLWTCGGNLDHGFGFACGVHMKAILGLILLCWFPISMIVFACYLQIQSVGWIDWAVSVVICLLFVVFVIGAGFLGIDLIYGDDS